jgi:hypothetical protein
VAEENRKSVLADILKRERLQKEEKKNAARVSAPGSSRAENSTKALNEKVVSSKNSLGFDAALKEVSIDIRYYFMTEGDFSGKFKDLYLEIATDLARYGISPRKFIDYTCESFDRFKKLHKLMPLEPMNLKGFKYVETSVRDLVRMMEQKFGK